MIDHHWLHYLGWRICGLFLGCGAIAICARCTYSFDRRAAKVGFIWAVVGAVMLWLSVAKADSVVGRGGARAGSGLRAEDSSGGGGSGQSGEIGVWVPFVWDNSYVAGRITMDIYDSAGNYWYTYQVPSWSGGAQVLVWFPSNGSYVTYDNIYGACYGNPIAFSSGTEFNLSGTNVNFASPAFAQEPANGFENYSYDDFSVVMQGSSPPLTGNLASAYLNMFPLAGWNVHNYPVAPVGLSEVSWSWFLAGWGLACTAIAFQLIFRQVRNLGADAPTM
jgi:hypothetical protein